MRHGNETFDCAVRSTVPPSGEPRAFFDLERHEDPGSDLNPAFDIGGGYCTCSCSNSNTCSNNSSEVDDIL